MEPQTKTSAGAAGRRNGHDTATEQQSAAGGLDILWDGMPPRVTERLAEPLDPSLVSRRRGRGSRSLAYLEGHAAIAQANRIFGHGGWGYELVDDVTWREVRSVDGKTGEATVTLLYCARVKVTVPGVPPRTDVGCQPVADDTADGHDTAYKGAVTDALKRALRSFGDQFGNALYGDGTRDAMTPALRESVMAMGRAQGLTLERLREAVRKRTGKELDDLPSYELAPLVQAMTRKLKAPPGDRTPSNSGRASR